MPEVRHERHFTAVPGGFEYSLVVAFEPRPGLMGLFDRFLLERAIARALRKTMANLSRVFFHAPGFEQTISWTYVGKEGAYVSIELLKGGVLERRITNRAPIGTSGVGSATWKPQVKLSGSDYSIRITIKGDAGYSDTSDAYFTITPRR